MMRLSRTYYVSSGKGNDSFAGISEAVPFRSLSKVNELRLQAGDCVLLERGSVFEDQYLKLTCRGTEEQPIVIGAYGEGELPLICANGTGIWHQDYGVDLDSPAHVRKGDVSSAVLLYDADNLVLQDLEITNRGGKMSREDYSAPHKMDRTGVAVVAQNGGTLRNITLRNLYVHDVHGNVYNKHMNNGGIYATCLKPENEAQTGVARFDRFVVENCFVYRVSRWGIAVGYTYQHDKFSTAELPEELFRQYGHEHILMRNNYVKEAGGDAITPMYALRPLVEGNTADSAAQEMNDRIYRHPENRYGKVAAGIWPWKCKDALFRYNEVTDTRLNQDGMAYDADSGDGTTYEYNYSRQNEGGCVMFCMEQAVNNTFCHNVSYDDLGGTISPADNPDAYVARNTFYVRAGIPFVRKNMDGGNFTEEDNTFITIEEQSAEDGEKQS